MEQGFILQSGHRLESGRPRVLHHGRLASGQSFLVRDGRERPGFWILTANEARARDLGVSVVDGAGAVTMRGSSVSQVRFDLPQDGPALRQRLEAAGIECFEADLRLAQRHLIDRGIRGAVAIDGPWRPGNGIDRVYDDPRLAPGNWTPRLTALSLDIETDPAGRRLLSIALAGCGAAEVLLLTRPGMDCPPQATACASERDLVRGLVRRVRELDPDVLTGWSLIDFDLAVLARVAARTGVPLALGRGPEPIRIRGSGLPGASQAFLPGRLALDGIQLLRGAFLKFESYSLEAVSREVLGRGKTITGRDRAEEILAAWKHDRPRLVEYNLNDAVLVLDILRELHLLELAVERSRLTGLPPDRVAASIAAFDFLYLSELHRRKIVAPSVRARDVWGEMTTGGHVLDPRPGLYRNIVVLDFKSLYPSIIRTFQIDPLGHVPAPAPDEDLIRAPNGAAFRREPGILPRLLDDLFPRREAAKAAGDAVSSHAIKILMNSFYGVLGTPACRFADPALANAITGFGREILLWSRDWIERAGHEVLYGDTDSLFVRTGVEDTAEAQAAGARLVAAANRALAEHVRDTWRVETRLELQLDRLYLRLLLPAVRHGTAGARKRYAGLVQTPRGPELSFTGMEVVRRDWTKLARRVQRELYERLFADRGVEDWLREVVAALRAGRLDHELVYRKALRRDLASYVAATPPHVAAARKMQTLPGRTIAYIVTTQGPEPAGERVSPIDHEHYVQKQVRAVAEPVLDLLGLEFDRVVGDDAQLRLF